jgi:hypothetical protein
MTNFWLWYCGKQCASIRSSFTIARDALLTRDCIRATVFFADSMGLRTPPVQVSNSLGDSSTSARQIDFENQLKGTRLIIQDSQFLCQQFLKLLVCYNCLSYQKQNSSNALMELRRV